MKKLFTFNRFKHKVNEFRNVPIAFDLLSYKVVLNQINALSTHFEQKTDEELVTVALRIRKEVQQNNDLETVLVEMFALTREICWRKLKMKPYDVQVITGLVLHQNKLAEMKTGEGKTLAAVLPIALNALTGKGVHLLTFNDYLAKRDAEWMRPVYEMLGLTVGFVQQEMTFEARKVAYNCDVTYVTAKEIGFDYLRSFIAYEEQEAVLRPFNYAIVDEADAILIDEARNPLVLAGHILEINVDIHKVKKFVDTLVKNQDFTHDSYARTVYLLDKGNAKIEKHFGIEDLYQSEHTNLVSAINLALHARVLLQKDIDYIVNEGEIKLIDEFTGRVVDDRKWQNGLQTAVEAKENLKIQSEGTILGSTTLQHFIGHYPKLAGMTATAQPAAEEFEGFYGLKTVVIPPNLTCIRKDLPDLIFTHKAAKMQALLKEVKDINKIGRPILIGTLTVKESEEIAALLRSKHIDCQILNAKNDELEAEIIASAGKLKMVTISTNMAGRGTDILLGGKEGEHRTKIIALGGLHVIGTNRHESLRIDNQLRGRAGRQGDPGTSQFILSFEDSLMKKYHLKEILPKKYKTLEQIEPIDNLTVQKRLTFAQEIIEDQMYEIRRTLYLYTTYIEHQRKLFQTSRQQILQNESESFFEILDVNTLTHFKNYLLNQYDKHWAAHLAFANVVKEGVHFVRLGGEQPIDVFRKKTAANFQHILDEIEVLMKEIKNKKLDVNLLEVNKPTSTWTYIINDNPFGNNLSNLLMGNMGMQVDPFTAPLIFAKGVVNLIRQRSKSNDN